jgi:hypothetical protein
MAKQGAEASQRCGILAGSQGSGGAGGAGCTTQAAQQHGRILTFFSFALAERPLLLLGGLAGEPERAEDWHSTSALLA